MPYRTIFAPSTPKERSNNFESYWQYTLKNDGDILEEEKTLALKHEKLLNFQKNKVRSRRPLDHPERFYKNYIRMTDNPKELDKKTLLLTCIYKFARHEWAGISAAWETIPSFSEAKTTQEKISRYHLCEEFCHVRLFNEMFRTFQLDQVVWEPMGKLTRWSYRFFSQMPEHVMATPAFLSELMGLSFYFHLDRLLDVHFADEPEAKARIRELLDEIVVDELAHIGQRRNFMGNFAVKQARKIFPAMVWAFWRSIPESKILLDVRQMIRDGLAFDYAQVPSRLIHRTWVPSYCQVS